MTAGGVKLRLCPFCGAGGVPVLKRSGAACFVHCNVCGSEGPTEKIFDYMPIKPSDLSEAADINELWEEAEKHALEIAAHKWNVRPWEGNFWPEDLERMEEKMEQEADV